jgi:hypothetical protein
VVAFAVVLLTYDLNQGPFRLIQAVIILAAGHGHWLLFPLTALAGTAGVLFVARALPRWRWMEDLGRNGLILLGFGGVVYHHANGPAAAGVAANRPGAGWSVAAFGAVVTALSVVAGMPVVGALARWVPQLVGRPTVRGPLLPRVGLTQSVDAEPTALRLASRIVVLRLEGELFDGAATRVGLLVPEIAGPFERSFTGEGVHPGFAFAGASHLGPTVADEHGMVQLLRCRRLLEGDAVLRELPLGAGDGDGSDGGGHGVPRGGPNGGRGG